jgi:hypothetical protein
MPCFLFIVMQGRSSFSKVNNSGCSSFSGNKFLSCKFNKILQHYIIYMYFFFFFLVKMNQKRKIVLITSSLFLSALVSINLRHHGIIITYCMNINNFIQILCFFTRYKIFAKVCFDCCMITSLSHDHCAFGLIT